MSKQKENAESSGPKTPVPPTTKPSELGDVTLNVPTFYNPPPPPPKEKK